MKLEEFSTVHDVDVRRILYPSTTTGGWGANAVEDGTVGGYEWQFRFLRNPGSFEGRTFPPGSGNVEAIAVDAGNTLLGTGVSVETKRQNDGLEPITGSFVIGAGKCGTNSCVRTTPELPYYASSVSLDQNLESLDTIGKVSVTQQFVTGRKLEGFKAYVGRDGSRARIVPTTGIRQHIAHGDYIRIGGLDIYNFQTLAGSNGDSLVRTVNVDIGSPVVKTSTIDAAFPNGLAFGETVRIGGHIHTLQRTVEEIQMLTLTDSTQAEQSFYALQLTHNGVVKLPPV